MSTAARHPNVTEHADTVPCPACGEVGRWHTRDAFGELWGCYACDHLADRVDG